MRTTETTTLIPKTFLYQHTEANRTNQFELYAIVLLFVILLTFSCFCIMYGTNAQVAVAGIIVLIYCVVIILLQIYSS